MKRIIIYLTLLIITGCNAETDVTQEDHPLFGSWRMTEMSEKKTIQKDDATPEEKIQNRVIINFFKDRQFTYFTEAGDMTSGKWMYDMDNGSGNFVSQKINDLFVVSRDTANNKMILTLVNSKALSKKSFLKFGNALKDPNKEPFSLENNQ